MRRTLLLATSLFLVVMIVVLLNAAGRTLLGRSYLDLTEEGLYTLADGSKIVLKDLRTPITLRYYFSKTEAANLPGIGVYGTRVRDLLQEYVRYGGGKVKLEVYDPRPDSEDEEWAQKYGISALSAGENSEQLYFGLAAVNSRGEEAVIPVFNVARQELLEYDITSLIYSLDTHRKVVVGLMSSLDLLGNQSGQTPFQPQPQAKPAWFFVEQLRKDKELRSIPLTEEKLDSDVSVLMLIHPKGLSEAMLYALDQFVLGGGRLFVAVDPYCESDQAQVGPNGPAASDRSSNLNALLSAWGVRMTEERVVADRVLAFEALDMRKGRAKRVPYVVWPLVRRIERYGLDQINRSDVVTASLEQILLAWPGEIVTSEKEGVVIEPLLRTTPEARLVAARDYHWQGGDPEKLLENYFPENKDRVLAVRIRGRLKSNFPDGPPAGAGEKLRGGEHLSESKTEANVLVVADVDFLADRFSVVRQGFLGAQVVSRLNDNLNFVENAVEHMGGSEALVGLRSRGRFLRPFTRVQEIERRAAERWRGVEQDLKRELEEANRRLGELQSPKRTAADDGERGQVLARALLDEMRGIREQRRVAQEKLRDVRRNLRQDKERLGEMLFLINTFCIPLLLIALAVGYSLRREKRQKRENIQ